MRSILIFTLLFVVSHVQAQPCGEVIKELEAMKRAQSSIMSSLANNHEAFAGTIEDLVMDLELRSQKVPQKALKSMNQTAQSFRERGLKAKRQADKLESATSELIERIEKCLK